MKQKKKNKFFTFLCSFVPGAAEMYMGFMKMGFSLMAVFFLCLMVGVYFRMEEVIAFTGMLLWFFGFFHARNLAACDDATIEEMKDTVIWEEFGIGQGFKIKTPGKTVRKWIAVILILVGASLLWNNVTDLVYSLIPEKQWEYLYPIVSNISHSVPQYVAAILIIVIGIRLIKGKNVEPKMETDKTKLIAEAKAEDVVVKAEEVVSKTEEIVKAEIAKSDITKEKDSESEIEEVEQDGEESQNA